MYSILKNKTKYLFITFVIYLAISKSISIINISLMLGLCLILNSIYSYERAIEKVHSNSEELNLKINLSYIKRIEYLIDAAVITIFTSFMYLVILDKDIIASALVIIVALLRFMIWDSIEYKLVSHITDLIYTNDNTLKNIL